MTQNERTAISLRKERDKKVAQIERQTIKDAKHIEAAKKYNVYFETFEEWVAYRDATDFSKIPEKVGNAIWIAPVDGRTLKEMKESLERTEKRLAKADGKVAEESVQAAEDARIENIENRYYNVSKEEAERQFKEFQEEARKDGIEFETYMSGYTKKGRHFQLFGNSGWTERSRHCYSLDIAGCGTVFTSGDFSTAYRYLMTM